MKHPFLRRLQELHDAPEVKTVHPSICAGQVVEWPVPKRILLVIDDADLRLAFRDRLLSMGFDVVTEPNGQSALSRISLEATRSPIQGVMLDVQMPVVDGIAVLRELRNRHPEIPVIVLLAVTDTAQLTEARKLGARTYLISPFDRERDWERIYWIFQNG